MRSVFFVCTRYVLWIVLLVDGVKSGGARLLNVGFFFYGLFTHPRLGGNYLELESSLFFSPSSRSLEDIYVYIFFVARSYDVSIGDACFKLSAAFVVCNSPDSGQRLPLLRSGFRCFRNGYRWIRKDCRCS